MARCACGNTENLVFVPELDWTCQDCLAKIDDEMDKEINGEN